MDPLHPILPIQPTLPPITPAPAIGRVDRDGRQGDGACFRGRRRPPSPVQPTVEACDGDDGSGLHIDVTA